MYKDDVKLAVIALYFGVSSHKIQETRDDLNLPHRIKKVVYDENEFKRLFRQGVPYN